MSLVRRPHFDWRTRTRTLSLGQQTLVMGILNITPDSFSDGGHFYSPEHALDRESTRPNAIPLTADEEQARVLPVIEAILVQKPETILSIDTHHASTAVCAVEAGVEIVNDVSGHLWDAAMTKNCAQLGCGTVLMHTRGRPQDWATQTPLSSDDILPLILAGLSERIEAATAAGIARNRIVLDPGFGFGKRLDENYPLLAHFDQLQQLNLPILAGVSRKGFLAQALAPLYEETLPPPEGRLHATTAANVAAILNGAHIVRTHEVLPAVEAAAIADRILAAI